MKFVILHGTGANHTDNWFPWLQQQLEDEGHEVWCPDLPEADKPDMARYEEFLLNSGWDFQDNIIIGHSSGAVAILGLLEALPQRVTIHTAVLVGSFTKTLSESPDWEELKRLFPKPFDFEMIKTKARKFIFIHSDNDPYCPIDQPTYLAEQLGGELKILPGMGHFSYKMDARFNKFPELLTILQQEASI